MTSVQKNLTKLGLDESDARIYLILAENGEMDVPSLVDKTGYSRTTIYNSIETLKDKKLLVARKIGREAYYNIEHPTNLTKLIDEKKAADIELERNINNDIKNLINKYQIASNQPGLYSFEGRKGIYKVYEDLLEDKLDIDSIEDKGEMEKYIPEYSTKEFPSKRKKYKIFNRVIAPSTNQINPTSQEQLRETRFVDVKLFPFGMDIKINKKKIIMVTFQKQTAIGVEIIHPEIVKNYQILFNYLWHTAKPSSS